MEFGEKLQQLRKEKGMTQEQLAKELFVSRTAISKWESGRGYPSIDSLKMIADYFDVTVDELLTCGEALTIAKEDQRNVKNRMFDFVFGLLDLSVIMFLFLPFLGQKTDAGALAVTLTGYCAEHVYVKIAFYCVVIAMALFGGIILVLHKCENGCWNHCKRLISLILNVVAVFVFTVSLQANCAIYCFALLLIKLLLLVKSR